jgi:hypothetical protein
LACPIVFPAAIDEIKKKKKKTILLKVVVDQFGGS